MNDIAVSPVLQVENLGVEVATPGGSIAVLENMNFSLRAGEVLCLAGESGSGKSMTALAIMGLLPRPMARVSTGRILLDDNDLLTLSERELRRIRASRVAMIFQEPMTSLNPVMTIAAQLTEVLIEHNESTQAGARDHALKLLEDVRLTDPARRLDQYPHELSGGMRQRVMIAMALACNPDVLIADEPTTALDVTVQAEILDLIRTLQADRGTAVLLITHDMGVVAENADRVIVMKDGQTVESAPVHTLFSEPVTPYTRELLASVPRLGSVTTEDTHRDDPQPAPVTSVDNLYVRFPVRGGVFGRRQSDVVAVDDVSFSIAPGETLALVGESGSGKSTIGKAMLSLLPYEGHVTVEGVSLRGLHGRSLRDARRHIQMIFQDPYASLDPRMTVGEQVAEPLRVHRMAEGSTLEQRVAWLFERVGLSPDARRRHPHEFSGGQRQRVCIARALALGPRVIVADECVSALDVSVQAQVLELLKELQSEEGIAYLFISHDMAVVEQISDRVMVLNAGRIMETGARSAVFNNPRHAYTRRLLAAVPNADPALRNKAPVAALA